MVTHSLTHSFIHPFAQTDKYNKYNKATTQCEQTARLKNEH